MRKSFTRLIGIFMLMTVFVLQNFANGGFPSLGGSADFTNHKKADALVLTASEAVVPGTGVIRLMEGGTTLGAYQATNSNVVIAAKGDGTYTISVNFSGFLQEEHTYTLEADANFVKASDNSEASSAGSWTVQVGDFTAPVLAATNPLTPANGGTSVQLTDDLTVKFSEDVQIAEGGKVYIYEDNGTAYGNLVDVVGVGSGLTAVGNVVTINPNAPNFEKGLTKYYVTIPNGVIVDAPDVFGNNNKNKFAGWLNNTTWAFTTRDIVAPDITKFVNDNVAKDAFDVFAQLDKKGKIYVLAVAKDAGTPDLSLFTAGNGMKSAPVPAAATDVKLSLTQYYNGVGASAMVEGGSYDVYAYTENAETTLPTKSKIVKMLTVTTLDVSKPTVLALYPLNGAGAADVNKKDYLTIKLSEKVKVGTGSINVYTWNNSLNHELLVSVPASSCKVSKLSGVTENDSLYIPVAKSLWVSSATYFVKYDEGIVTDLAGNKLAAVTSTDTWKFTVADFLAPTYTIVPANGATAASQVAPQVTITFNEPIYWDDDNNPSTPNVAVTSSNVVAFANAVLTLKKGTSTAAYTPAISGNVLTLTITTVASKDSYELSIDTKKIYDASGNKGTTVNVVNFTIKDFEAPVVTIEPLAPGASDNILVKFNEPVFNADGSAITDANVASIVIFRKGTDATGAIVAAAYSVAADAKSFIINPTNDFTTPGDNYYVRIGAGAVKDAAGNANALKEQIITVADFIAPTATFSITSATPVNPSSPVEFTFSEAMKTLAGAAVSGDATALVNLKENGENVPFTAVWDISTPSAPKIVVTVSGGLKAGKTYTVGVGKSLQDVAGNAFAGISKTFSTWSADAPAMISVAPANNATEQANDVALQVNFDQVIAAGTGTITLSGTSATVSAVTIDGSALKIAHSTFVTDETITVNVPAGYVKGLNGIDAPAVSWTFKTHETVAPIVSTYSPAIGSNAVGLSDKLTLTFSENIVKKTGQILIKDFNTDVTVQTLTEANTVVKNNNQLEITLTSALVYNTKYYVVITNGFVEDTHGNKYAGISGNSWYFTTVATPGAFTVASSVPANNQDKVAAGLNPITVDFNRDIKAGSLSSTAKITLNDGTTDVIKDVANSSRFSISGKTLTINTLTDIVANKTYTLTLEAGIVKDNYNTDNTAATIVFYTKDNNAPKVASHTPATDATGVAVNTTIVLTWDETPYNVADGSAISAANIKTNSIVTVNGATNYTASVSGLQWTLTLDAALTEKSVNTVVVDLSKVKDSNGIAGSGTTSWSFTTVDATCDKPTAFNLTENTKGTEVKFTVDFNEKGTVYYAVLPAATAAPSAAEIIALNQSISFAGAGTSAVKTVTGLTSAASYTAYFVAVDAVSNQSAIYMPASFTTADVVAPVVASMVPANGATGVAANSTLVLNFNEPVAIGVGHILIREVATDIIVEDIVVSGANTALTNSNKTATITRGATLESQKAYYVEVSTGTFVDASANKMAGIYGSSTWAFTIKDTVAPLLSKTTPDYATTKEIVASTTLSMEFNEAMKVPTGVVYVKYASNNNVFEVVNASALSLSGDNKKISFNLTNVPTEQTEFYVDLSALVLKDLADNVWSNTLGTTWNFIILDQTAPALASSVPANNATGVAIDANIVLTFTEAIYKAPDATDFDGTAAKIKDVLSLKDAAGNAVAFSATIDAARKVVTIDPTSDLVSESTYTVYVSPVVDDHKNVSSEIAVKFTTKDMTKPYVSNWNPEFDTTMNPKTGEVTVTFNEAIYDEVDVTSENNPIVVEIVNANIPSFFTYNVGTISRDADNKINSFTAGAAVQFTGTISADRKKIVLTPVAGALPLTSEAWYKVALKAGVVEDIAGNGNVEDYTIFQIEDHVKPVATAYAPQGATADDAKMEVTFNEPVKLGTGNFYIRNYVDGTLIETIAVNASNVKVDGSSIVIAHADFPANMNFYVNADAGAITDLAGNAWAGIATSAINTWKFSTADAVIPELFADGALSPAPGSTNVSLNTNLEIVFSKQIQKGTGYIVIYNEDWTPFQVIDVTSAAVTLGAYTEPVYQGNRVAIISHNEFKPLSKYYVRVGAGTFKDNATPANLFAGLLDNTWYFTTEDDAAPEIVSTTPADNATGVSAYADLTITFDRDVLANAAGKLYVYEEVNNAGVLVETIDPTDATKVAVNGAVVTISRSVALKYNANYYVIIGAGAFTNTASAKKPYAGLTTTQGWNFTTSVVDIDNPMLVTWTPDEVTLTDNHPVFEMTFSEDVKVGTGNLKVFVKDSNTATLTLDITKATVAGNKVTLTYDAAVSGGLNKNTEYYVLVDASAVTDIAGNTFAGVSDPTAWTFVTGADFATPVIPNPVSGSLKVYPNPFADVINVVASEKLSKVVFTNIAGQKVKEVVNPSNQISTSDLRGGIYMISAISESGKIQTLKVVKK
jgi:methionine-rich copper-binding protein CopC